MNAIRHFDDHSQVTLCDCRIVLKMKIICARGIILPSLRRLSDDNLRKDNKNTIFAQIILDVWKKYW